MIIFGERINGMYRDVRTAIAERNATVIQDLARAQLAGGADVMDLNVGPAKGDAAESFVWLAQTVHEITDKPLSLDSAKADLLVQVVPRVRQALPDTKLVINSCTAAPDYMAKLVPLAAACGTGPAEAPLGHLAGGLQVGGVALRVGRDEETFDL